MSSSVVAPVYLSVVDSVVNEMRETFSNENVDDSVLTELQGLWELKMMNCGVIQGPFQGNHAPEGVGIRNSIRDLNVPYEGPEENEIPTAELLFPPTPLQTPPLPTPLPVENRQYQYFPSIQGESGAGADTAREAKVERPTSSYMQQQSCWNTQKHLGGNVNVACEEARDEGRMSQTQPPMKDVFEVPPGKRKREDYPSLYYSNRYISQQDGSSDNVGDGFLQRKLETLKNRKRKKADALVASMIMMSHNSRKIPQHDGNDDLSKQPDGNDDPSNDARIEDYNTPSYYDIQPAKDVLTPKSTKSEATEDDEPPLNEDDDEDEDDLELGDEEPSINDLVLAQFDKVSRTKSRWRCVLKDGIMRLNDEDFIFAKATGDFDF